MPQTRLLGPLELRPASGFGSVAGYMSGDSSRIWWADKQDFPIEPGTSQDIRLYDDNDNWAGDCGNFDPASWEAELLAEFLLDGDRIMVADVAAIACGWSECRSD